MSEPAAKRLPIDLDEFDRRLRQSNPPAVEAAAKDDPLAELARLVSSSPDPFAPIFAGGRPEPRAPQKPHAGPPPGFRPAFDETPRRDAHAAPRAGRQAEADYPRSAPAPRVSSQARPRRGAWLSAGVAIVVIAGVGATFLSRGHVRFGSPPTILADAKPYKISPPSQPIKDKVEDSTTLLNKSDAVGAPAQVVNTAEQPVDLSVADPPSGSASANAGSNDGFAFPAPRRVKTVLVRPDGTIISQDPDNVGDQQDAADSSGATALSQPSSQGQGDQNQVSQPSAAAAAPAPVQNDPAPAPAAAAPAPAAAAPASDPGFANVVEEAAQQPQAAPSRSAPAPASRPLSQPQARQSIAQEARIAELTPAQPAAEDSRLTGASGTWAVQLAAPGSERSADLEIKRLERRFADALSGRSLVAHSAQSNGRTVWRVRVADLSREDAGALCGRIKSGGGACFVARN